MPAAKKYSAIASGLLAASIPKSKKNYIFWFRPEVIETVRWAGNPNEKKVDANGRLSPRGSFDEWKESVREHSRPWKIWEIDAALELRAAILGVDLRRQYEKEQRARAEAERAVKSREELVEIVSHDLKNPLTSMVMNIRLLERLLGPNEAKVTDIIARFSRSTKVMLNLIEDVLNVAKMEAGEMPLEKVNKNLLETIRDAIDLIRPIAVEKMIDLQLEKTSIPCTTDFDEGRVLQVLSNLIGNAVKFTPEGGRITVSIDECGPEFLKVSISDTGPGIPKENLLNIFDRFWQANQAKKMGTGLGLAIVKGIITSHGGEIWAESDLGKGTTFHFTLPLS